MVSITLAIENELREKMKEHPEVKWSQVARQSIKNQIEEWEELNKIASKSKFTEKDAKDLSSKVDKELLRHFEELANETRNRR